MEIQLSDERRGSIGCGPVVPLKVSSSIPIGFSSSSSSLTSSSGACSSNNSPVVSGVRPKNFVNQRKDRANSSRLSSGRFSVSSTPSSADLLDPFCEHFKLRTTCYECSCVVVDDFVISPTTTPLTGRRRRGLSSCSFASYNDDDDFDDCNSTTDSSNIVATWPQFNAQTNNLNSSPMTAAAPQLDSSTDEASDIEPITFYDVIPLTHQPPMTVKATVPTYNIVDDRYLSASCSHHRVPPLTRRYLPNALDDTLPSSSSDDDHDQVTKTGVSDNNNGKYQSSSVDAVAPLAGHQPYQQRDKLTEWTLPIIVGTLILGRVFGFGFEAGATISTLVMYLVKNHAPRLMN